MLVCAKATAEAFGLKENDTLFLCLGTQQIAGLMMVVRALLNNCNLYVAAPSSNPFLELDEDIKLDFAAFVPLQIRTIIKEEKHLLILNKMKAIIIGGAPLDEGLENEIQKINAPVYHTYGMTETYTHIALKRLNGMDKDNLYHSIQGVNFSVDNRDCLVINSPIADVITNDIVDLIDAKTFKWLGRFDNVINSGGVKIFVEELEKEIAKYLPENINFFCAPKPDETLGEKLILVIENPKWAKEKVRDLLDVLKRNLAKYHSPTEVLFVEKFVYTNSGKINRSATISSF
ncbi:MAG: AMP-binding protein [Bacteroidetes bacterium]|nr:AMP-binding protein [Bacteroidota bacterium]